MLINEVLCWRFGSIPGKVVRYLVMSPNKSDCWLWSEKLSLSGKFQFNSIKIKSSLCLFVVSQKNKTKWLQFWNRYATWRSWFMGEAFHMKSGRWTYESEKLIWEQPKSVIRNESTCFLSKAFCSKRIQQKSRRYFFPKLRWLSNDKKIDDVEITGRDMIMLRIMVVITPLTACINPASTKTI